MVGSRSKLKRNVSWGWISTPPYLGHPIVENPKKKLLKDGALLARINKFLPVKYCIILFYASIKPILVLLEYSVCLFGEAVMQAYWMRFLKFKKDVCVLY